MFNRFLTEEVDWEKENQNFLSEKEDLYSLIYFSNTQLLRNKTTKWDFSYMQVLTSSKSFADFMESSTEICKQVFSLCTRKEVAIFHPRKRRKKKTFLLMAVTQAQ